MSTFTLEIQLAPNVETLLNKFLAAVLPKSAAVPSAPFQTPEELAARARMNPPSLVPAPAPRPTTPAQIAPPARPASVPAQAAPGAAPTAYTLPTQPYFNAPANPQQFRPGPGAPGYPANPTSAPMQGALANPVVTPPIAPTYPNAANSAPLVTPATVSAAPTATPGNRPMQAAPVAGAPQYSAEDLGRAAAQLMDAGKQQECVNLLQQFGIPTLGALPKERFGEFATALRGLGARI